MFIKWGKCGHCGVHTGDKAWHDGCPEQEHRAQQDVSFPHALQLYNGVLAQNVPGVCARKGFLSNRIWIQWELDSFASEPKSINYGLSPEQAAVINWERARFKYPFKSFETSRGRLPWSSLRGKRNITKVTCLNKNLRTIRFHAIVTLLFWCENI